MSGTQSTLPERTSILCKDHPSDKKLKSDKTSTPPTHEFDPTGLVQRCVIIQKDENGFGLTVSGDNPVFVQLVKEDGAAMRAGVQTGDRIIKVNGTLVTHSNHVEVVKLIKSGSYVALTVLGRPPGLLQLPFTEAEGDEGAFSSLTFPHLSGSNGPDPSSSSPSLSEPALTPDWATAEEFHQSHTPKLLKHQEQIASPSGSRQDGSLASKPEDGGGDVDPPPCWPLVAGQELFWNNNSPTPINPSPVPESPCQRETPCHSPKISLNSCPSPDTEDTPHLDSSSSLGSPSSRVPPQIIGAEDDDFIPEQEQMNGQCSCFHSIELIKSRPAHLAAFIHHVVSQFDPAPLLCYLYAELYKQTSSKEMRRVLMDTFFIDKTASLKVAVPESIIADLERSAQSVGAERKKSECVSEEVHRQYVQQLQDTLLPDIQKNLEDFRHKRNMGLTLAEAELARLDAEPMRDCVALERERSCAEQIISKIEDILVTSPPPEEEKSSTIQLVMLAYMKQLGVKVKESRGLEQKTKLMNIFPKIKKTRFTSVFPPRRPSKVEAPPLPKTLEPRPRTTKAQGETGDTLSSPSRVSEGSNGIPVLINPSTHTSLSTPNTDAIAREPDTVGVSTLAQARPADSALAADSQDSFSNTHFDFSTLEHLHEEEAETEKLQTICTPRTSKRTEALCSADVQSEDEQAADAELEALNWQTVVSREALSSLNPQEIKRQEVINELFNTERAHVRMLKVLEMLFYLPLTKDAILPPSDVKNIFTNLEEIVQLHMTMMEQMAAVRKKNEMPIVDLIGDELLSWFSGEEEEKIKRAAGTYCSNQPFALELIKSKQKKEQRFNSFIQEAESNRHCRRLQLKDIIPVETQRLTKYPLLLENIARYTEDPEEKRKIKQAGECCRQILTHVNQEVKEAENKQRLEDYQRRLELSSLKQSENPMIAEFKNLDLTKRKLVHEGPLSWKVNRDKTIELYTLLLEDILVLLQKQDEKLILKCHSKNLAGTAETKHIFSPIIKLSSTVMVRTVATDNRSFFVLSMSDNVAQIYELMAQTVSEQKTWQCLITQRADCMKTKLHSIIPLAQSEGEEQKMTPEPASLENVPCPDKDDAEVMEIPACSTNPFQSQSDEEEEQEVDEEFVVAELSERLTFLKRGSRHCIAMDADQPFHVETLIADQALTTLSALRKLLLKHVQEDTSFSQTSEDRVSSPSYMLLEVLGGADEAVRDSNGEADADADAAGDVAINLKQLLSSSSQSRGGPDLSRQIMTHLRLLQASLHQLKETEINYTQLCQRLSEETPADVPESSASGEDGNPETGRPSTV